MLCKPVDRKDSAFVFEPNFKVEAKIQTLQGIYISPNKKISSNVLLQH
jgi:hypothetical protein